MVDSISKTRLRSDQIAAMVTRSFGAAAELVSVDECEEGWFNAVHRLTFADGTEVLLKVAPPPEVRVLRYEADILSAEVEALRLVAENTDVPVPVVVAWDDTRELVASSYFFMTKCPGVLLSTLRPQLDATDARTIDEQVIQHVAAINSITAPTFGRFAHTAPRSTSWTEAFGQLVSDLLADAADAGAELPATHTEVEAILGASVDALDTVRSARLVHWDLWDPNVFVDPDSLQVVGIIDFERALWADPLMEAQFTGKRASDQLAGAYGATVFDAPYAVERRRLYDLYLYLVMLVECSFRNYPTPDIANLAGAMLPHVLEEIRAAG